MSKVTGSCTVFFEGPFWVGVFERIENGKLSVAKKVFGAEPSNAELLQFIADHYYELEFSPAVTTVESMNCSNPKKALRDSRKAMKAKALGTKSQQALKLQQEQFNESHRIARKEARLSEEALKFELKQQKKREKHKGH